MDDSKRIIKIVLIVLAVFILYTSGCFIYKQKKFALMKKQPQNFKRNWRTMQLFGMNTRMIMLKQKETMIYSQQED